MTRTRLLVSTSCCPRVSQLECILWSVFTVVDLLRSFLVGEGARATNYDYTKGTLNDLIDVIIEEKARLFVCVRVAVF